MIKLEQSIFNERIYELDGEKWIAASLLVHELRAAARRVVSQRRASAINRPRCLGLSGADLDLCNLSAPGLDGVELPH